MENPQTHEWIRSLLRPKKLTFGNSGVLLTHKDFFSKVGPHHFSYFMTLKLHLKISEKTVSHFRDFALQTDRRTNQGQIHRKLSLGQVSSQYSQTSPTSNNSSNKGPFNIELASCQK